MSSSSPPLLADMVVAGGRIRPVDKDDFERKCRKAAKQWGDGRCLKLRLEPEEDAIENRQYRHLFGHVYTPVHDYSGHTIPELHLMAKTMFMPDDGRTSITQLNRDELADFIRCAEVWMRQQCPDAFLLEEPIGT